jgi:hypothetical protein
MQPSDRQPPGEAAEQYSGDTSDHASRAVHSGSVFVFPYQRRGCPAGLYGITRAMQDAFREVFSDDCLRRPGVCDA